MIALLFGRLFWGSISDIWSCKHSLLCVLLLSFHFLLNYWHTFLSFVWHDKLCFCFSPFSISFLRSYPAFMLGFYAFDSWMNANQWIHLKRCLSRIVMGLLRRTSKIDILTVNFQGSQLSSLKRLYFKLISKEKLNGKSFQTN